jgi:hypothetical protein
MNKICLVLICVLTFVSSFAQDEEFKTIFKKDENNKVRISGFGGPMMIFTCIGDDFAHMMGGGGGIIVGNSFFGGYGFGMTNEMQYKYNDQYNLNFGHGGFWIGHFFAINRPIHFNLSVQAGWGNISQGIELDDGDFEEVNSNSVFVLTPIAEVELNFSRFFILGVGTSASYVSGSGIGDTSYTAKDFFKPSVYLSFKFGWFH